MGLFDFLKKNKNETENESINEQNITIQGNENDNYKIVNATEEISNTVEYSNENSVKDKDLEPSIDTSTLSNKNTQYKIVNENNEVMSETTPAREASKNDAILHSVDEHLYDDAVKDLVIEEPVTEITEIKTLTEETLEEITENEVTNEVDNSVVETVELKTKESLFAKMKKGLLKTKDNLASSIDNVFKAFTSIDDDFYDELEETLILADLGARTSMDIVETLRDKVKELKIKDTDEVKQVLIDIITEILNKDETELEIPSPTIILVIGVNGVGKTTSIGKLANLYKSEGKNVLLAAGDTFRAAAIEQLEEWGKRSDIPVIKHEENTDSSAVIYDAIKSSQSKNVDILICDTAGRLHNKKNLMAELEKINRVINKEYPQAHLETLLVLDGTAGQNALEQAKQFNEVCEITGLVLTKLDGTAKGGVIISIKNELNIPVRFIGVGEQIDDLQKFDASSFSKALFE